MEWRYLPESILSNITRKLCSEDVCAAKMVCKNWFRKTELVIPLKHIGYNSWSILQSLVGHGDHEGRITILGDNMKDWSVCNMDTLITTTKPLYMKAVRVPDTILYCDTKYLVTLELEGNESRSYNMEIRQDYMKKMKLKNIEISNIEAPVLTEAVIDNAIINTGNCPSLKKLKIRNPKRMDLNAYIETVILDIRFPIDITYEYMLEYLEMIGLTKWKNLQWFRLDSQGVIPDTEVFTKRGYKNVERFDFKIFGEPRDWCKYTQDFVWKMKKMICDDGTIIFEDKYV
ncbi:leucine-rich repeat/F-box domain-containing protein [Tetraselmis virus 1]|uniref:Leucine-rich repeat/F-box domain-containing protein n=1 Tax=Tetraselmis virus 1 TaxID=2060617 RepID=A0A2P0VNN6_9VIRU|nr:leucine-rich repeat/F-box domain-containing protein [Tetraselmis virus 1]AUF82518.1 leucine-rich repeat/F-box domain-containing protein [Tetraselmis virus 1]